MKEFKSIYKLKEILKPEDVDPNLIKRLSKQYGSIDMVNDFFTDDLTTLYKTKEVNDGTNSVSHKIIPLASFATLGKITLTNIVR